jgi:hypothetical protein
MNIEEKKIELKSEHHRILRKTLLESSRLSAFVAHIAQKISLRLSVFALKKPTLLKKTSRLSAFVAQINIPCSTFLVLHSLFIIPCSLFPVHYSLFIIPCSLFLVHYSLFTIPCSIFLVHYSLFIIPCSLFLVHYSLFIIPCPFSTAISVLQ